MSEPLPDVSVPNATSRFNVPAGAGFVQWFAALRATINVQGVEILNRARAAVAVVEAKLPREVPNTEYAAVVTDDNGRISEGTRVTGEKFIAAADIDKATVKDLTAIGFTQAGQSLTQTPGDYAKVTVDSDGRIAEDALGLDGRVPAWVLEAWASRMGVKSAAQLGVIPVLSLAAFGDSMTAGYMGGGPTWPAIAAAELKLPVYNGGITSQTSTEIAIRQGGLTVLVTAAGNSIPASGPVIVTVTPTGDYRTTNVWTFPGKLGGIPGILAKDAGTPNVWTFTRSSPGTATVLPAGSPFISDTAAPYNSWITVIWAGRNNINKPVVERDIAAMVASLTPLRKQCLVLSICNAEWERSGTWEYNDLMAINNALKATYGENFVDIRRYLIDYGLAAAGITPTAADTTAIGQDRIPPSLLSDQLHLTGIGYTLVGKRIAAIIKEKSWA